MWDGRRPTGGFWGALGGGSPNPINPSLPAVVELCLTHELDPEALANELLAFVTSKNLGTQLSIDGLDAFEHEVGGSPDIPPHPQTPMKRGTHTLTLPLFSSSRSSPSGVAGTIRKGTTATVVSMTSTPFRSCITWVLGRFLKKTGC